jgi:Rrf2 family protein
MSARAMRGGPADSDRIEGMRVSAKSDYALRALIEIGSQPDGVPVSAEEIGRRQDVPHGFLQAILADLRRSGIVRSVRGQSGGWRMERDLADVTVADIIRAVDGPLVSVYGLRPESVEYNETARILQLVWIAARANLRDVFEGVTIAMLIDGRLPSSIATLVDDEDAWQPH